MRDEIYDNDIRYLEIADQIENFELKIGYLMESLNKDCPPPDGYRWSLDLSNRPYLQHWSSY